jgi:hypothetical protein
VYIVISGGRVAAKGVLSGGTGGGDDYLAGVDEEDIYKCQVNFTDIQQAFVALPGQLRTG